MRFIYINSRKDLTDSIQTILEVLEESVSIISYSFLNNDLIIYFNYSNTNLEEIASILMTDLYINANLYESNEYDKEDDVNRAIKLIKNLFVKYTFNDSYLSNKLLLESLYLKKDSDLEKLVLNSYYKDLEMYNTIKVFLEENQNSTIASQKLYLHRNTLNQRLDKFNDKTGFNVKKFIDAYLIYSIIK